MVIPPKLPAIIVQLDGETARVVADICVAEDTSDNRTILVPTLIAA